MAGRSIFLLSTCALLSGCVLPGTSLAPTPYPAEYIPTVVYMTALSIDAATLTAYRPTASPTLTPTFIPPTLPPSETPTTGPRVPLAALQVRSPGPMSRIVSPLQVKALAVVGESRRIEIDLFGEDGRLLGRTLLAVSGSSDGDTLSVKMPFEIRAAGERGFVQVSTKNARGLVQSLITVPVLLLSSGESQINPAGNTIYERVAFVDLPPEATISGGALNVTGQVLPYNNEPMVMELITDEGQNLSLRLLTVSGEAWQAISTTLPFKVDSPTPARLFVYQADDLLNAGAYVFSQPLMLSP